MSGIGSSEVDALLGALADSRRRHALDCLQVHGSVTLPDLAEAVLERESGASVPDLPAETVTEVYFSLYHRHVPKLERADLVEYHQERDLVTREEGAFANVALARDVLDELLDDCDERRDD